MRKAIFLDRDGTLIPEGVRHPSDVDVLPDVMEPLQKWHKEGYALVMVTNQPDLQRGRLTREEFYKVQNRLLEILRGVGIEIDGICVCPHAPEIERCECRKPLPGLLLKAAKDWDIDLSKSWVIGDRDVDVEAGLAAGCQGVKLHAHRDMMDAYLVTRGME